MGETMPPVRVTCSACQPTSGCAALSEDKPVISNEALLKDLRTYADALSDTKIMERLDRLYGRLKDRNHDAGRYMWTIQELLRMPFETLVTGLERPIFGDRRATYDEFVFAFVLSARLARGDGRVG